MNILVTGTATGIGRGIALRFLKEGHRVYGFDRETSDIQDKNYTHYLLDIQNMKDYPLLPPIDILVNNAGQQTPLMPERGMAADQDGWMTCLADIEVNLKANIAITEHYGIHPGIRSIVMIGSASGHTGAEFPGYTASKGGILAYTKNVALRIAPYGATCNSLDFGGVTTELNKPVMEDPELWKQIMDETPLKRWMSVEEAADWAYFISVTNRFCSGQNILIDGLEAGNANFVWP